MRGELTPASSTAEVLGAGRSRIPCAAWRGYERLFRRHWEAIDADAAVERAAAGLRIGFDFRVAWVVIVAASVFLAQMNVNLRPAFVRSALDPGENSPWVGLSSFGWWHASTLTWFFLVPALCARAAGIKLRDCGLRLDGIREHAWIYAVLFLAILPAIFAVSFTHRFLATYPMYKLASRSWIDLVSSELMYGLSFVGVEFFFRGFTLFALRRSLGSNAIFVMIIPYCMIHFSKPLAEAVGSIFAAIVLGTLALRTRSIWCGVAIHVSVAWTMDLLALAHTTGLPPAGRLFP